MQRHNGGDDKPPSPVPLAVEEVAAAELHADYGDGDEEEDGHRPKQDESLHTTQTTRQA